MTVLYIILGILVLLGVLVMLVYNRLIGLRNEASQGFSGIEVQLKRRADLIPNLVQTVQGYAAHEAGTLEAVTRARTATVSAGDPGDVASADGMMRSALGGIFGLAEAYPDLKADANFQHLQDELTATEDRIAAARRYYNSVVQRYNTRLQSVPDNIIANMFHFSEREFYRLEDDDEGKVVPVTFEPSGPTS